MPIFLFLMGFHNTDVAYNMDNYEFDTSITGITLGKNSIYILGVNLMFVAFLISFLLNLVLLSCLGCADKSSNHIRKSYKNRNFKDHN